MKAIQKLLGTRVALALAGTPPWRTGSDEGQTLAEYALILALIAVVAVLALVFLGGTITDLFSSSGNAI